MVSVSSEPMSTLKAKSMAKKATNIRLAHWSAINANLTLFDFSRLKFVQMFAGGAMAVAVVVVALAAVATAAAVTEDIFISLIWNYNVVNKSGQKG